jgi:hypothetical protein
MRIAAMCVLIVLILTAGCGTSEPSTVDLLRAVAAAEHDASTWRWASGAFALLAFAIGVGVGSSARYARRR